MIDESYSMLKRRNVDFDSLFDFIDNAKDMPKYVGPTKDYFPRPSEITTALATDLPNVVEYFTYLEDNLTDAGKRKHEEALSVFHNYLKLFVY